MSTERVYPKVGAPALPEAPQHAIDSSSRHEDDDGRWEEKPKKSTARYLRAQKIDPTIDAAAGALRGARLS